ncbi:MAG: hypothetical protein H0V03_09585 [Thermoleophilaceae bacterium]|nr:hypothetical protein [Thermoleophilaceae bacterium]
MSTRAGFDPRGLMRRAWALNPPLAFVGAAMGVTVAVALVGLVADPRVITGAPAWLKPMKFAVSIAVYCFTVLWLLTFVRGRPRLVRAIGWVTAVGLAVEMALIVAQVVRGTTSHFNVGTAFDAAIWSAMGAIVVSVWVAGMLLAVLLVRQRLADPALAWSLRLGLVVAVVGMAVAFLMTSPTPEQLAAAGGPRVAGGHSVGVADGGPGLPVTGWSTVAGDLRVAHFVGLHGLQVLPAVGYLLMVLPARPLGGRHRVALVWTVGLAYLGLVLLLAWQALRGQSVIAPDAITLAALAALGGGAVAVALAVLGHGWRTAGR